jgi:L-methionine (R)-S-oxide reductase
MIERGRPARYERIYAQLQELIEGQSPGLIAAMATICAVLQHKMPHHSWTGFYHVAGEDELHVGPYQGAVACQVLRGGGVCLHSVHTREPVVVPDVHAFPGHIACDARAQSEIVIPVKKEGRVVAVLDIDSHRLAQFDDDDVAPLQRILGLLQPYL